MYTTSCNVLFIYLICSNIWFMTSWREWDVYTGYHCLSSSLFKKECNYHLKRVI